MGKCYRVSLLMCVTTAVVLAVGSTLAGQPAGAEEARTAVLDRAGELAEHHRYQEVVELLEPVLDSPEGALEASAVAFELGRAYFHLGRYDRAYAAFSRVQDPDHFEGGVVLPYLEASAYLLERKEEALTILERLLASGRTDLELAVTLPGERAFLQDPDVWRLLDRYARGLDVSVVGGTVMGISLGDPRPQAEPVFGEIPTRLDGGDSAAPRTVFEPSWDDTNHLVGIRLHALPPEARPRSGLGQLARRGGRAVRGPDEIRAGGRRRGAHDLGAARRDGDSGLRPSACTPAGADRRRSRHAAPGRAAPEHAAGRRVREHGLC